jgi:hypothetical protein
MAVVNTKTASVTAKDATPSTLGNPRYRISVDGGSVPIAAADDDASVFRVCRVHSSQRIFGVFVTNDAITGGTDYDLGFYRTAADGGALVDKDNIVDGATHATARSLPTALPFTTFTDYGKRVWEIAGLSSDPNIEYDICWTANTVGTGAGTLVTWIHLSV